MWDDNRLHWFYPLHRPPAVPKNAQKLPHRYGIAKTLQKFPERFVVFTFPTLCLYKIPSHPNRDFKEVGNGGRARYIRAKWDSQNRANREQRKQLRGAAAVFNILLVFILLWRINIATINKDFFNRLLNKHLLRLLSVKTA